MTPLTIGLILLNIIFLIGLLWSFRRIRANSKEAITREKTLHDRDEKLRALVDESREGLMLIDEQGFIVEWNHAVEQITGIEKSFALGKFAWDVQVLLIPPERKTDESAPHLKNTVQTTLLKGSSPLLSRQIETEICQLSGNRITIEQLTFTIKSDQGYWIGSVLRDISERKQAENVSKENLQRLNALLNNIPDIAWIKDTHSQYVAANQPLANIYQTTPEAMIGKTDFDLCPPDLAGRYQADDQDVMLSKRQKRVEERLVDYEGIEHWLETIKNPILNLQGEAIGTAGIGRDITERRKLERIQDVLYRISEAAHTAPDMDDLYHTIHNSVQELMPAKNLYIAYYDASSDLLRFPYHADEKDLEWPPMKAGKGLTRYVYTTGKPLLATPEIFQQLLETGEIELIGQKPVDWLGVPLRTQHGIIGVIAVQTYLRNERLSEADKDILVFISTQIAMAIERRQIEEDLRNSQINLAEAQRIAQVGSWDWNLNDNSVSWSDELVRIAGWNPGEPHSYDEFQQLIHSQDRDSVLTAINKAIHELQPYSIDHRIVRSDGTEVFLHRQVEVIADESGKPSRMVGTVQDITAVRQAEVERDNLIQELQKKNTELDGFTYTVSHDLRAPLVTIRGFMGFLEKDIQTGNTDQLKADMDRITAAIQKMQRFLDELLEISRAGRLVNPPEPAHLQAIVSDAIEILRGRIDDRGVQVLVGDNLPVILCDRLRFTQVIQNLVENAVKFMGEQPNPVIEIGYQGIDKSGLATLFVRDNGIGIEPKYHEKIFGLFDKLDPISDGTGVGLTLVKRIIEAHHGKVWLKSGGEGAGSTFYFTCPLSKNSK